MKVFRSLLLLALLALGSCDERAPAAKPAPPPSASQSPVAASATGSAPAGPGAARRKPLTVKEFARLFTELSEADSYFFSDNYVSNETSYLQVASALKARPRGGAYVGVGPEQNFSYIALLEPELAFIVDIRRQNALQHLLYKAIFERADTRADFLSLLTGRPLEAPPKAPSIQALVAALDAAEPDRAGFDKRHAKLLRTVQSYRVALSKQDKATLQRVHQAFFKEGLGLKFELHEKNGRTYPAFRQLIKTQDPQSGLGGFLATEKAYRTVRDLSREHRIIPVVGDFAGRHALASVARELTRRDLPVNAFYVSNVEQYVIEPEKWPHYVKNVLALPSNERSVFIRCYLDQGRRHPRQLKGHRTATVLASFDHFKWRQKKRGYGSFWQLATDGLLDGGAP